MKSVFWSKLFALGIALATISALSEPAISCSMVVRFYQPSACKVFQSSEIVFLGTALEELKSVSEVADPSGAPGPVKIETRWIHFHIDHNFKGVEGNTLDIFSNGLCDGGYPKFEKGRQYVVYASPSSDIFFANLKVPRIHFNDRSNFVENLSVAIGTSDADEDLSFFELYNAGNVFGYISGTIRILPKDYKDSVSNHLLYDREEFNWTPYAPLSKRVIKLKTGYKEFGLPGDKEFSLITNEKGQFSIGGLSAGVYHIEVPGYDIVLEPEIVRLPENGCSEANLFVKATD